MKKLEVQEKYRAYTEEEAKDFIETQRTNALTDGYTLKKAGYEYKAKKSKGMVVDECWITTTVKVYNDVWEE